MTRIVVASGTDDTVLVRPRAGGVELVVNGVTISVQSADADMQIITSRKDAPALALPRPEKVPKQKIGRPSKTAPSDGGKEIERLIIAALTEHGPLTTGDVMVHLGFSTKDPRRQYARKRIHYLSTKKRIRRFPEDAGKLRPRFELITGGQAP